MCNVFSITPSVQYRVRHVFRNKTYVTVFLILYFLIILFPLNYSRMTSELAYELVADFVYLENLALVRQNNKLQETVIKLQHEIERLQHDAQHSRVLLRRSRSHAAGLELKLERRNLRSQQRWIRRLRDVQPGESIFVDLTNDTNDDSTDGLEEIDQDPAV